MKEKKKVTEKIRVVLDIPNEAREDLKSIKDALEIKNNKELVRYALGLMSLIVKHKRQGYDVLLKKDDEVYKVAMPFLGFS